MIFVNMILATLVYSGLSSTLQITGNATFRVKSDIRITDITIGDPEGSGIKGDALIEYEPTYTKDSITTGFTLPIDESEITYKVTVENSGEIDQTIYDFIIESTNNENIVPEIKEYTEKEVIGFKTKRVFYITFKTTEASQQVVNLRMKFDFRKVYYVTYEPEGGSNAPENQIKYEKENIELSSNILEKRGYTFNGWKANEVNYEPGSTYEIDEDVIMYADFSANEYELTLDNQNATTNGSDKIYTKYDQGIYLDSELSKEMTTSENPITVPTKTGDVFEGYYTGRNGAGEQIIDSKGYITENIASNTYAENTTLYAKWTDPVVPTVSIKATKKTSGTAVATNTWSSEGLNFVLTEGTVGSSGATIYYCKDTNNSCDPTTEVTSGTIIAQYNTLEQNEYYIRYKIVSGEGLTSGIKTYKAKVDNVVPTLTMLGSGKYELGTTSNLVSAVTFGISGGATKCVNLDKDNVTVTTLSSIQTLGNQDVSCTATSNAGLSSSSVERYYMMSWTIPLNYNLIGIKNGATKSDEAIIIPPGGMQFGPYIDCQPGCYRVLYVGENLNISGRQYDVYSGGKSGTAVHYDIIKLNYISADANYFFYLDSYTEEIEVTLFNPSTNTASIIVTDFRIEYYGSTCPS